MLFGMHVIGDVSWSLPGGPYVKLLIFSISESLVDLQQTLSPAMSSVTSRPSALHESKKSHHHLYARQVVFIYWTNIPTGVQPARCRE